MALILSILALSIVVATVFNYILIVLSDSFSRGREIAVMKSYGAGLKEIAGRVFSQTLLQISALLVVAVLLIIVFRGTAEQVLQVPLSGLVTWQSVALVSGVVLAILLVSTYVQSRVYNNIPVSTVFRNYRGTGRKVKLALLFVQVAAAAFLTLLLVTVYRQYDAMLTDDPGYGYDRLLICQVGGTESSQRDALAWELGTLPGVEMVARASTLPLYVAGGNNITVPGNEKDLFNIADLHYADENYLAVLDIPVIEGSNFSRHNSTEYHVMVSRSFREKIMEFVDWNDGVLGKAIGISGHNGNGYDYTITGVYEDFKIGTIGGEDYRPTVLFYSQEYPDILMVRVKEMEPGIIRHVQGKVEDLLPQKHAPVWPYNDLVQKAYEPQRLFRKSITIASLIVMIIVIVGLLGYMRDETARREKEIAVRKINGATVGEILQIMSLDIVKITVPAMAAGIIAAYYVAGKWMEEFSVKVTMHWWIAVLCAALVAAISLAAVMLSALAAARRNPAESIKTE